MRVFGLALTLTLAFACAGRAPCGPTTCIGCCDSSGTCAAGSSALECGRSGVACSRCPVTDTCSQGVCTPTFSGQGGGSAGGASGGGSGGCRLPTACVMDVDCPMGSRCNTALMPPSCQVLYCGAAASQCSAGYLCDSQLCFNARCLEADAGQPFGAVLPATVDYITHADGGFIGGVSVWFSDDARNDCAAMQARMEYGRLTGLTGLSLPWNTLTNGRVIPWITDAMARMGTGPRPAVAFTGDPLSGANLHQQSGTFTAEQVPTPGSPTLLFSLRSVDGGFAGTWRASPICP